MPTQNPDAFTPAETLLAGLLNRKRLALELSRSERTIIRYERAGMPFIKLGMQRLYDPARVRAWILSLERSPAAPVRGRPAKRAL